MEQRVRVEFYYLVAAIFFSNWCYAMMAPFYPREAYRRNFNDTIIGFVFSVYSIFGFVSTPFYVSIMNRKGRKWTVFSGSIIVGLSMTCYGGILYLDDWSFLLWSFVLRILQGIGNTGISTAAFAAASDYEQSLAEKLVGYIEISSCLGIATGPIIGTAFYNILGFIGPFIFVGILMFLISPFLYVFIHSKIEETKDKERRLLLDKGYIKQLKQASSKRQQLLPKEKLLSESDLTRKNSPDFLVNQTYFEVRKVVRSLSPIVFENCKEDNLKQKSSLPESSKLTFTKSLAIKRVFLDGIVMVVTLAGVFMLEPVLYKRFLEYELSNTMIGIVFSANALSYALSIPFLRFIPRHLDRRAIIGPACLVVSFAYILIGPIFIPSNIYIMLIGLLIQGASISFILIPAIPDMTVGAKEAYPFEKEEVISNYIGGITNFVLNGAKVIGPPLGGIIMDQTRSFISLCIVFGIIQLFCSLLFIVFNNPCVAYKSFNRNKSKASYTKLLEASL